MVTADSIRILLVEDEPSDFYLFKTYLSDIGVPASSLTWARSYDDALTLIEKKEHDIYFFDYRLGGYTGNDLIEVCVEKGISAPIIILTGVGNVQADMQAMSLGASDYLVKGEIDSSKLERTIRYSIEQNRMLKKLRASEEKFRGIFENSYDVIYITDIGGRIVDINVAGQRLFGYSHEELLQFNLLQFCFNQDDRFSFLAAITSGDSSNFEITLKDREGNKKYCTLTSSILKTENNQVFYQGILHDMTKRKKAELDLIAAEKLAITGKIARMLAHEVRNPLTSINLSVEQLESSINDDSLKPFFEIIKRNSKRINALVTELLETSKPAELRETATDIAEILTNAIDLTGDRARLKNISIETDFPFEQNYVLADESKLTIALLNIIANAIEAVEEGRGKIRIKTDTRDGRVFITIADNGCGIPEEHVGKIFDAYFTSKPNGMGLGLSSSQNIIKTHNGKIDILSQVGKGTTFIVELTLVKEMPRVS